MIKYAVIIAVLLTTAGFAQTRVVDHSTQRITLEFQLPQLIANPVSLHGREYTLFQYEGSQPLAEEGAPIIPYTIARVAIPPAATLASQFQILEQSELNQTEVLPAVLVNGLRESNRPQIDPRIYGSAAPYPAEIVEVSEPYIFRNMRMVDVKIYPLQFYPAERRVRLLKRVSIQLSLRGGQPGETLSRLSQTGRELLKQRLVNFEQAQNWALPSPSALQRVIPNYDFSVGNWYKIPVSEEGIYHISGQFLQDQGVAISAIDPATIQVFNYGGAPLSYNTAVPRPADLNEIAIELIDQNGNGAFEADDAVLFYGRDVEGWIYSESERRWVNYLNPYSFTNYFLITFNQNIGKRIPAENSNQYPDPVAPVSFFDQQRYQEERYNILQSGIDWYWLKFQGSSGETTLNIRAPQGVLPDSQFFSARFKGGSGSHYWEPGGFNYKFTLFLNGGNLGNIAPFSDATERLVNNLPLSGLHGGDNQLLVKYEGNQEGCYAYFDYFEVRFKRSFQAENGFLKFYYDVQPTPREFLITGLPAETNRVWDVTDFANVKSIIPLQNGSTVRFHAQENLKTAKAYYVFSAAAIKSVSQMMALENSANLRNPDRRGQLLLITADEFYDAAEEWENFKESYLLHPLETERVKVSEIFREFSSGVADPSAIRDFIKFAYENWTVPPDYIQLLGDGSYDYRNIELTDYENRVPVFEITANDDVSSRVTDNFFTAIYSQGLSNLTPVLAVARMPANSTGEVQNYLRKMRAYAEAYRGGSASNGWQTVLTFVADDECRSASVCNEWFHLQQTENIVSKVPGKFDTRKIYLVDYDPQAGGLGRLKPKATADLLDQINRGTLMINFFGHGDPTTWAHEQVLTKARDLPQIDNGARLPIWVAATCTWGKYDDPRIPSMAEEMVWSDGGGIASIAASRPSFAFQNEVFAESLYNKLFRNRSDNKHSLLLGLATQLSMGGGTNDQKYHLLGDVALHLADPIHVIKVVSISADTLKALSTVTINASVHDSLDNFLPGFNGKALLRVYDAVDSLTHPPLGPNYYYTYLGGTIFKGIVSVENGQLQGSFIVPKSIKYKNSRTGRVSIYAWNADSEVQSDAVGYNNALLFNGTVSLSDTRGPEIQFGFPDQPDFFDGDYVSSQPTLIVRLKDDNGINLTGETGHRIELTIDNSIKKDLTEFFVYNENSYTEGQLQYTLPALSSGRHQLTISAWDNLNNYSEQQISFTTAVSSELTLAQVVNYPNPFARETQFTFQFQSPNGPGEVEIKIYTVSGRLIQIIEDIARPGFNKIHWDGRDRNGDVLANGVYLYKVTVNDGQRSIEKIEKLAIVR